MDEQKINKVSKAMAVNIKREKKKHTVTMSHAKHLYDSPYSAAFCCFLVVKPTIGKNG